MKWLFGFCFLLLSGSASAKCVCAAPHPIKSIDEIKEDYIVVKGKVDYIRPGSESYWSGNVVTIKVEMSWFGGRLERYINIKDYDTSCSVYFEEGRSYLLYLYKHGSDGILSTNVCAPNMYLEWAVDILLFMGPGDLPKSRRPGQFPVHINDLLPTEGTVEVRPWLKIDLVILISALVIIFLLLYIFRKRLFKRHSIFFG